MPSDVRASDRLFFFYFANACQSNLGCSLNYGAQKSQTKPGAGRSINVRCRCHLMLTPCTGHQQRLNKEQRLYSNTHHSSLRTLYCSLVLSCLHYCAEVWGNDYKTSLQSLTILEKRAIRTIHNISYLEHADPLLFSRPKLKSTDIVAYQTAIIM